MMWEYVINEVSGLKTCYIESSKKLWVTIKKLRFINLHMSLLKHKTEMTAFR